ncbi:MAG: sigma-70 family RNA polymerase sigma factor [Planctomycetaceae bacterium]|nr:sigma-70 family RNA polymerase sigma factor [Planctomycetaceae bacterium]
MTSDGSASAPSNPDELSRFIDAHRNQLLAWINRSLGPLLKGRVESEDILQETALSAVASLEQFQAEGRDPFRVLCQLAEHRIIDAHRFHVKAEKRSAAREVATGAGSSSGEGDDFLGLLVASITSPSAAFSRNQKELQLQLALQELTEEQRTAIRLRYVEGLPTREIADRLEKSDGAVRVLLTRTISVLQERLAGLSQNQQ